MMQDTDKYVLKGMIGELGEYLKEGKLDEVKNLCQMINNQIDKLNPDTQSKADQKEEPKEEPKEPEDEKTMAFIKLIMDDNQEELFKIYGQTLWNGSEYDFKLIRKYIEPIKDKNASMNHIMGFIYQFAKGVPTNYQKSMQYYEQCWENHMYASYNMYYMLGMTPDSKYLIKSADLGFARACYDLGKRYQHDDVDKAIKYLLMAEEKGYQDVFKGIPTKYLLDYIRKNKID